MRYEDVVVGRTYKYTNPAYPKWVGLEFIATAKHVAPITWGEVTKPSLNSEIANEYPIGAQVSFSAGSVEPVALNIVESMFE